MKRKYVPISKAAEVAGAYNPDTDKYEFWLISLENMGFCKDGVTRWYWFEAENGEKCYTLKR